jgi:tetratricopeptide (TPR) repeat protein
VSFTPSLFVIDPVSGRVAASHFGGISLAQLNQFLDQGSRGLAERPRTPADSSFAAGEGFLGHGQLAEAAAAYRRAIAEGGRGWSGRENALAQLAWTLMTSREWRESADVALTEGPGMKREASFARVALAGLSSANSGDTAAWAVSARKLLLPMASEASGLPGIARNDRFQLFQNIMNTYDLSGDSVAMRRWGDRWLGEIERTVARNDDERTALDVARVDAVSEMGAPERAIAALQASERAMPGSYNACLRLAQVLTQARRYDEAIAACDRGLTRVDGPIGRTWLLETKAQAYAEKGDRAAARQALEQARRAASDIVVTQNRESNLRRIDRMLADLSK